MYVVNSGSTRSRSDVRMFARFRWAGSVSIRKGGIARWKSKIEAQVRPKSDPIYVTCCRRWSSNFKASQNVPLTRASRRAARHARAEVRRHNARRGIVRAGESDVPQYRAGDTSTDADETRDAS